MIVATAGHIDHGKTTLVRALTGVDTDRLPQEKARGISIDLGFAYWRDDSGAVIGFVDVPGHERFVRNTLAGVCAIDFALLVVAADDGPMPQTREHLNILDLLGIRRGLVAVTKADRVEPARVEEVVRASRELLAGTTLAGVPVVPVCAQDGTGIEALQQVLAEQARSCRREQAAGRHVRYAIDRVFTIAGSGTVVTGTVFDGMVRTGDRLVVSPSGREVRVRAVQKDGVRCESAEAGERCAINLAGVEVGQLQRGDWVMHAKLHEPGTRLDVELRVLPLEPHALRHWTPVHLHLGTRDVTARVALRRGAAIAPGERGFARLVTDRPVSVLRGDRFILRDQSALRTIGGGVVLDGFAPARRLPAERGERHLRALAAATAGEALRELVLASPDGVAPGGFARNFNLDADAMARLLQQSGLPVIGTGTTARVVTHEQARLQQLPPPPVAENPEHGRLWDLAQPALRSAGRAGLTVAELAQATQGKEAVLCDMLHRRARSGDTVRIDESRFYLRSTMDDLVAVARTVASAAPDGRFSVAQFRDAAAIGRRLAIKVLEAMDRLGVTQRQGDERVLRAEAPAVSHQHQG